MSHPVDPRFDFPVKLGLLRPQDVPTARRLLQALEGATTGMHDASMMPARDDGIIADGENEDRVKPTGMDPSFPRNGRVAPSHDFSALSEGPVHMAVLLVAAVTEFNQHLDDYNVQLSKIGEQEKIARRAGGAYGGQNKSMKAITAVLAHLQLAHLLARGAFPEKISQAENCVNRENDSFGQTKPDEDDSTPFPHTVMVGDENSPSTREQNQAGAGHPEITADEGRQVRFAVDQPDAPIGPLEIQPEKTGLPPSGFAAIADLAQRQKTDTIARILDHTLPLQHAFNRLDQRVARVEAQLHQTPYNGS